MSKETAVSAGEPDATRASHNASPGRKYPAACGRFRAWAEREPLSTIPAAPETVPAYPCLGADEGLSLATLRMDRAAIRYHHTEARCRASRASCAIVTRALPVGNLDTAW